MQWFKHLLGNGEGDSQFVSELVCKYGSDGYYVFYRTLEIMCVEFDVDKPAENTFLFEYFYSKFAKIYRKTLRKVLESCNKTYEKSGEKRGIGYREDGEYIYLRCCKLKKLADKYTQKTLAEKRKSTHKVSQKGSLDLDIDLDKESTNTGLKKKKTSTDSKRDLTRFPKENYDEVINEYEKIKGIKLQGKEYLPIQQSIKTMFLSKRSPEDIKRFMRWLEGSRDKWTTSWTIDTVRKKLPEFVAGKLIADKGERENYKEDFLRRDE